MKHFEEYECYFKNILGPLWILLWELHLIVKMKKIFNSESIWLFFSKYWYVMKKMCYCSLWTPLKNGLKSFLKEHSFSCAFCLVWTLLEYKLKKILVRTHVNEIRNVPSETILPHQCTLFGCYLLTGLLVS